MKGRILFCMLSLVSFMVHAQDHALSIGVYFDSPLHRWDGFGVNYVETSQTIDYTAYSQDYGGFSLLQNRDKQIILDSIFGDHGLKINILKMFLDPWHQSGPDGAYRHSYSTKNMLHVASEANKRIRKRNESMEVLTTLYGPPAYMSTLNQLRGKYLDTSHKLDLAHYMINWVKYLQDSARLPVKYLSLHNEGEDWGRMPADGGVENSTHDHLDYNLYWSPEQSVHFLKLMRPLLDSAGLQNVKLTPGEYTNWYRFNSMGYARAISRDPMALRNLGLITSHGFYNGRFWRLFSGTTNHGTWLLQAQRPELHAWTTSMSWMNSTIEFANLMYYHIYLARVNAVIPWAFIQRPELWANGDPNPGNAVTVHKDSTFHFTRGYYLFKQLTRAGRPGMEVVSTMSMDPSVLVLGFSKADTPEKDSFVIINNGYSFAGLADALELTFTIDSTNTSLLLSHKAPTETSAKLPDGVRFTTLETKTGYTLEAAIPWSVLSNKENLNHRKVKGDVQIRSGAEDVENIVGWTANASQQKELTLTNLLYEAPKIDGVKESLWASQPSSDINQPRLQGGRFPLSGQIQFAFDNRHLYIFADIQDDTNKKFKQLLISPEGTNASSFLAYRTSYDGENYEFIGEFTKDSSGRIRYESPGNSVTTFIAR